MFDISKYTLFISMFCLNTLLSYKMLFFPGGLYFLSYVIRLETLSDYYKHASSVVSGLYHFSVNNDLPPSPAAKC